MKKLQFLLLVPTILMFSTAVSQDISKELEKAYQTHASASTFDEQLNAARMFAEVSDENPGNWLAAYWASFAYSQAGMLSSEKLKYYEKAFHYLLRVSEKNDLSSSGKVYVLALESLICGLAQGPNFASGNNQLAMDLVNRQKNAMTEALKLDSESPLIYVLLGTQYISDGQRSNDYVKTVTGKLFLKEADKLYAKLKKTDSLTPDRWNQPWIKVWLDRSN